MHRHRFGVRKRALLAGLLALGLFWGILPGAGRAWADAEEAFWWDVNDTALTSESCGTGGSPEDRPAGAQRSLEAVNYYVGWDGSPLARFPEAAEAYTPWRDAADLQMEATEERCVLVDGRLLCDLLLGREPYEGEKDSYGYQRWRKQGNFRRRVRGACFDLATGRRLGLSDLFYDGVNYIAYINGQAARALMNPRMLEEDSNRLSERDLRRPFSGFPRDYPYFRIAASNEGGRMLVLAVDGENPLFDLQGGLRTGELWVPLPESLSPYGLPWAEVTGHWETMDAPPGEIFLARVSPGLDVSEEAAARINRALEALAERAAAHPDCALHDASRGIYPRVRFEGRQLDVSYCAEAEEGAAYVPLALLGAEAFDLNTGQRLDGDGGFR